MSDIRTISSRALVSQESIQFIRPQLLTLNLVESRPNTKMFVFFGSENVTSLCGVAGSILGVDLITNSIGQITIILSIPASRFNTGNHEIIVSDTDNLALLSTVGSVYGSAKTNFSANGTISIFQSTNTTITTVQRVVPIIVTDPLAQSFFTTGVTGGMFLTSIDAYFQTKDSTIPVRCEIRPMVNGFPSSIDAPSPNLISIVAPANVNTSLDASVPTKFVFNPPLYLKENSDYCFILRSNSNNYNAFTSRMGENSVEDGRKIFSQPYIGSLFKSENAITWTAEQFEDIKFVINKAKFDTSAAGTVEFGARIPALATYGYQFITVTGSNIVTFTSAQEHGLEVGSLVNIGTRLDALYSGATFNGIPYAQFSGSKTVSSVINRNKITFQTTANATSTGPLNSANILAEVIVLDGGINYITGDTISFTGGSGTGAAGTLNISGGSIKSVTITNSGTGYVSKPSYVITSTSGSGAKIVMSVTPTFAVTVNKPMTGFIPKINIFNHGTSSVKNTISTTIGNYESGNLNTYTAGKQLEFIHNAPYPSINQNSLVASGYNETGSMSGVKSAKVTVHLNSSNPNVSPVIDTNNRPVLSVYSTIVNKRSEETVESTNSSGSLNSIVVTSGGSGYTVTPNVSISAPDLAGGVQAVATVSRTGSSLNTFTITTAGSGYTSTPIVTVTRGAGDTTGVGGAGQAVLNTFNTELLPTGGLAKARYITKKTAIQIISTGARLFSVISSVQGSSVDWYIRTSLSGTGTSHDTHMWKRFKCDTPRNRSASISEKFEYEFYIDDLPEFDNYDLKCVMTATDPTKSPVVNSYRMIVVA